MPSWATVVKRARSQLPESLILGMVRYGALANAVDAQRLGARRVAWFKPLTFAAVSSAGFNASSPRQSLDQNLGAAGALFASLLLEQHR